MSAGIRLFQFGFIKIFMSWSKLVLSSYWCYHFTLGNIITQSIISFSLSFLEGSSLAQEEQWVSIANPLYLISFLRLFVRMLSVDCFFFLLGPSVMLYSVKALFPNPILNKPPWTCVHLSLHLSTLKLLDVLNESDRQSEILRLVLHHWRRYCVHGGKIWFFFCLWHHNTCRVTVILCCRGQGRK